MTFSERLLVALLDGLAADHPLGSDTAMRIVRQLLERELLSIPEVGPAQLLRAMRQTSSYPDVWSRFEVEARRRGLPAKPADLVPMLRASREDSTVRDLLELARPSNTHWRGIVYTTLVEQNTVGLFEDVRDYLSRRELLDPANPKFARTVIWPLISSAFRHYLRIPTGTWDFRSYLFRRVRWLTRSQGREFPKSFPTGQPLWFANLSGPFQK